MSPLHAALFVGVLPTLVALAALLLARQIGRGRDGGAQHTGLALAIALGTVAAHLGNAFPNFPPVDVTDRLPFLVGLALLLGLLEANWPSPWWARWENRLGLTVLGLATILGPILDSLTDRPGAFWLLALVTAWLVSWSNLEALASRLPALTLLPWLAASVAASGLALLMSGTAILGLLGLGSSVAIAACWFGSFRSTVPDALARGAAPILVTTVGGLLLTGYVYAALPARVALILLLAPFGAWAGAIGPLRALGGWKRTAGIGVATLIPLAVAIGLAVASAEPEGY